MNDVQSLKLVLLTPTQRLLIEASIKQLIVGILNKDPEITEDYEAIVLNLMSGAFGEERKSTLIFPLDLEALLPHLREVIRLLSQTSIETADDCPSSLRSVEGSSQSQEG